MQPTGDNPPQGDALREEASAWLARLRGPSTSEDHAAFEAWYDADPCHAAAYEAVLESWEATRLAAETPAGQARQDHARGRARRQRYAIAAIAASVAIFVLAFAAFGAGMDLRDPARPVEFASRGSEIRTIELADGSRVTLDAASLLQGDFSVDERRVVLSRGRARFAVAHDSARPFIVATPAGVVIAHGTVFDVSFDGTKATVSLIEGSVEVRSAARPGRSVASRMLSPGQRVIMAAGQVPVPAPSVAPAADWPHELASFKNAPLGEVIAAANRGGPRRIVVADPALARLRFTGSFKTADAEQLARMLAAAFDLELSRPDDRTFVLSPPRSLGTGQK